MLCGEMQEKLDKEISEAIKFIFYLQYRLSCVKVILSSDCTFVSEIHVQEAPHSGVPAFRQFFNFL